MAEPADVFADAFSINVMPFGCILTFSRSRVPPVAVPGELLPSDLVATIRLTPEFLKRLTFIIRNQILFYERTSGKIELPSDAMARVLTGSNQEAWNRCWEYTR